MLYVLVTLFVFILVFAMMAIGLILRNKPIAGTCASLSNIGLKEDCEVCGGDANKCQSAKPGSKVATALPDGLFRDAGKK